jgi:hypothetical protein
MMVRALVLCRGSLANDMMVRALVLCRGSPANDMMVLESGLVCEAGIGYMIWRFHKDGYDLQPEHHGRDVIESGTLELPHKLEELNLADLVGELGKQCVTNAPLLLQNSSFSPSWVLPSQVLLDRGRNHHKCNRTAGHLMIDQIRIPPQTSTCKVNLDAI